MEENTFTGPKPVPYFFQLPFMTYRMTACYKYLRKKRAFSRSNRERVSPPSLLRASRQDRRCFCKTNKVFTLSLKRRRQSCTPTRTDAKYLFSSPFSSVFSSSSSSSSDLFLIRGESRATSDSERVSDSMLPLSLQVRAPPVWGKLSMEEVEPYLRSCGLQAKPSLISPP